MLSCRLIMRSRQREAPGRNAARSDAGWRVCGGAIAPPTHNAGPLRQYGGRIPLLLFTGRFCAGLHRCAWLCRIHVKPARMVNRSRGSWNKWEGPAKREATRLCRESPLTAHRSISFRWRLIRQPMGGPASSRHAHGVRIEFRLVTLCRKFSK